MLIGFDSNDIIINIYRSQCLLNCVIMPLFFFGVEMRACLSSQEGYVLYTTFVCLVTIILGEIIVYNKYVHILLYVIMLIVIIMLAPIKSEYRPKYEGMVRVKIKIRTLFWLIVIVLVDTLVLNGYEMLVASVLYILSLDVIGKMFSKIVQ